MKTIALKIRINESKTVQRLVQEGRKVCRGFGGEVIKDWATNSMTT